MQTEHLLAMLARDELLKKSMTILDIGTGPGVVPLRYCGFLVPSRPAVLRPMCIQSNGRRSISRRSCTLRDRFVPKGGKVSVKPPVKAAITASDSLLKIPQQADLMVFSNVLNGLSNKNPEQRADIVMHFTERLARDGTVLIIEQTQEAVSGQIRGALPCPEEARPFPPQSLLVYLGHELHPGPVLEFCDSALHPAARRIMETLAACDEPSRYMNTDIKIAAT